MESFFRTKKFLSPCVAVTAAFALNGAVHAQSAFPATQTFENDSDAFVPTNSSPLSSPPYNAPGIVGSDIPGAPEDFVDNRDTHNHGFGAANPGLIEEVPSGFNSVPANGGSNLGVVYPFTDDSYDTGSRSGPFGFIGYQQAFPGTGNTWGWQIDMYALPATDGETGFFWWTNAAADNVTGGYLTESGFAISPGATDWMFTTTTGGQPFTLLPTGQWYHLEVVYDRSGPNVVVHHRIYNANRTVQLYSHTLPAPFGPASSSLGGPLYTWFAAWDNDTVDELYVDNAGNFLGSPAQVTLVPSDTCLNATENTLTVDVRMTGATQNVVGGQFFLQYDSTKLTLASAVPGDAPFTTQVYECSTVEQTGMPPPMSDPCPTGGTAGLIDYAVGVPFGNPGTTADTVMARLTFNIVNTADACNAALSSLVNFRTHVPPSRLTNAAGQEVTSATSAPGSITIDRQAPAIACPPSIVTSADAGTCTFTFNAAGPPHTLGGNATIQNDGPPHNNVVSMCGQIGSFGFVRIPMPAGTTVATLGTLSADYKHLSGCFGCGSPRFQLAVDTDNNGISNGNIFVYWGAPPSFNDCAPMTPVWQNTGNFVTDGAARWDATQLGGAYGVPYATVAASHGTGVVLRVTLVTDNGCSPASDHCIFADNIQAASTVVTFENTPTASDNCDTTPTVTVSPTPPSPFPVGTTTLTYTATDDCGNMSQCVQTITVNPVNDVVATVELADVNATFMRCIIFETYDSGGSLVDTDQVVVNFAPVMGESRGTAIFQVPCGVADCMTARDRLHTLRRTDLEFGISGTQYVADFTDTGTDDSLISGNLNDDGFIDILDFGAFAGQFNTCFPTPNTTCSTIPPHADFDGVATAPGQYCVTAVDYTFISGNFLVASEAPCAAMAQGIPGLGIGDARHGGPVTRISVRELARLGMSDLSAGDLNRDGWLDQKDVAAFLTGGH